MHRWRGVIALGLVLSCSACQGGTTGALFPEECPKEPAADVASAGERSYEDAIPDVVPALPPREEPQPPPPSDAAGDPEVIAALPAVHLPTRQGHRLLAIDPQERAYKVIVPRQYVACGQEHVSQIYICVSEAGLVSSMWILKHSMPVIDLQLAAVVLRWRYHPHLVEGRATAFCYPMNYRVR